MQVFIHYLVWWEWEEDIWHGKENKSEKKSRKYNVTANTIQNDTLSKIWKTCQNILLPIHFKVITAHSGEWNFSLFQMSDYGIKSNTVNFEGNYFKHVFSLSWSFLYFVYNFISLITDRTVMFKPLSETDSSCPRPPSIVSFHMLLHFRLHYVCHLMYLNNALSFKSYLSYQYTLFELLLKTLKNWSHQSFFSENYGFKYRCTGLTFL